MGFIINPFMVAAAAVADTTKIQVRLAEFDEDDDCACTATGELQIWEDDSNVEPSAGDLEPEVGDWIAGYDSLMEVQCAQVVALNSTEDADGYTYTSYNDCDECNTNEGICAAGGGGPGGP